MSEWEVFLAIVAILGFGITIFKISAFFNSLRSTMCALNTSVIHLTDEVKDLVKNNRDAHKRLWDHKDKQDEILADHETRITLIEGRKIDGK